MARSKTDVKNSNQSAVRSDELKRFHEADWVILGDGPECIFSTDTQATGINNNILVVGGSGSGKTVSIAEALFLEAYQRSIVATVTKRRIVDKYTPLLRERGYNVLITDFVHPERGNAAYDPLDFINSFADISFVAKSIVLANPKRRGLRRILTGTKRQLLFLQRSSPMF